ncbi:MAG: hypothetical protein M1818_007097 [Claussenomyces sp. TS43310]|nr:MAG: hypothetical protein M1818_007097 [Claussenomyces sp. TS43310]
MISVASLLNPTSSDPRITHLPTSPSPSTYTTSSHSGSPLSLSKPLKRQKMTKDGPLFAKGKIKGTVNFPPFQELDEKALSRVKTFRVSPLQHIQEYPRHIPYNSEKKSFLEKTGRESFEVFQYVFQLPGEEKEYLVLWDYNIGLVRITPFFKCCKYSKTTPAKMLNLNPGLKEITHSITGGALAAQGYWMPFSCALAVCATFCDHISGALIPIFGPDFPSKCTPVCNPLYSRMVIDASIISSAIHEANVFREHYSTSDLNSYPTPSSMKHSSASPNERAMHDPDTPSEYSSPAHLPRRLRVKRAHTKDSFYATDTDASESSSAGDRSLYSPVMPRSSKSYTSSAVPAPRRDWKAAILTNAASIPRTSLARTMERTTLGHHKNALSFGASPWLSAIPRSVNECREPEEDALWRSHSGKRRAVDVETDDEYDGEDSASGSENDDEQNVADKNAARLLMKLSVRDGQKGVGLGITSVQDTNESTAREAIDSPRIKRRRATSL